MISKITKPAKNFLFCSLFFFIFTAGVFAQYTPNTLTYQAVARDSQGKELAKTALVVKISILANEENGLLEWNEEHEITTNDFGLFTLNIGAGERLKGSSPQFKDVNWSSGAHYLKVEINFGNGFINMGTTQMLAVPYALYAAKSGNSSIDFTGFKFDPLSNTLKSNDTPVADLSPLKQTLEFDQANYHLSISGVPGVVDLRQFIHAPQDLRIANNKIWLTGTADSTIVDLLPYKQSLSVNASSKLEISNGNSVQVDTSNVNEIQGLSLSSNLLQITSNPVIKSVDLSKYLDNTDAQTLSINSNSKLEIFNGNSVKIDTSNVNEIQNITLTGNKLSLSKAVGEVVVDPSETNEIQDLSVVGNILKLDKNTSATSINLTKYLDNTDAQNLLRSGTNLEISGGNQVDVSDMINLPWTGFSGSTNSQSIAIGIEATINWNDEIQAGNTFSNFTPSINGLYNISFSLSFQSFDLYVRVYRGSFMIRNFKCSGVNYFTHSLLLDLTTSDNLSIRVYNNDIYANVSFGNFYGFRVK